MSRAYYNEHDPLIAAWLRQLIRSQLVADGEVDERSIEDVRASDLRGFTQCHFFAGIGGWSIALRLAGWPDDRRVWTGSCPCQPFSQTGKGAGFADERHLWPAWFWLIDQCRPECIFGEQVESPAGRTWLDLVSTDLEAVGYAVGPSDLPVAGVGAPGIRQRLFWVADVEPKIRNRRARIVSGGQQANGMAGCDGSGLDPRSFRRSEQADEGREARRSVAGPVDTRGLVDRVVARLERQPRDGHGGYESRRLDADSARSIAEAGFTRGFWDFPDWILCRDGAFRPVEPGTFPLADGIPARVGRLRGYGNAINPQIAAAFIAAYRDVVEAHP